MRGSWRWLVVAVVLTSLPVATGVLVLGDERPTAAPPPTEPSYASTPLSEVDTSVVTIRRAPFCDALPEEAVSEALGGEVAETVTYANGEAAEVVPGLRDVSHEYGCRISGPRGAEVRAWLFAPPVTRSRAEELAGDAAARKACTQPADAPSYGAPSVALLCPAGDRRWASYRGLFGDAWLTCSLAAPASFADGDLLDRTGRWCAAVVEAAGAPAP